MLPARDEEASIRQVVTDLRAVRRENGDSLFHEIIVCDNGSTDQTAMRAAAAGARVVTEPVAGYGNACRSALRALQPTDAVVFVDADGQFIAEEAITLVRKLEKGADLVIGSRVLGNAEPGALSPPQRFGNWLATRLIRFLWGAAFTDLGPFRAIRTSALDQLHMQSRTFGWTVEMQSKAALTGLVWCEVPVSTQCRQGRSQISGTLFGVICAGCGILSEIARIRFRQLGRKSRPPYKNAKAGDARPCNTG